MVDGYPVQSRVLIDQNWLIGKNGDVLNKNQFSSLYVQSDTLIASPVVDGDITNFNNIRVYDLNAGFLNSVFVFECSTC